MAPTPAPPHSERAAGGDGDHGNWLYPRDRRKENATRRGHSSERGDDGHLPGRPGAPFEPRGTGDDDRTGHEQKREARSGRVELPGACSKGKERGQEQDAAGTLQRARQGRPPSRRA